MIESQTADYLMKTGIEYGLKVSEQTAKWSFIGLEKLVILIKALATDKNKIAGLTNLKRIILDDKTPAVKQVPKEYVKEFGRLCKKYGVLFTAVSLPEQDFSDVIFDRDKALLVDSIFEKMGFHIPHEEQEQADTTKKASPLAQSSRESKQRGELSTQDNATPKSVVERIEIAKVKIKNKNNGGQDYER